MESLTLQTGTESQVLTNKIFKTTINVKKEGCED